MPLSVRDAYRTLDIVEGVSGDEIKNAYRIMALRWHPDRHHNNHNRDAATRRFLEITNAYRTLVRQGRVQSPINPHPAHREPPPTRRPPPMTHKTSSESTISIDSFVHMVASGSTETLTTPASSKRESIRSSWKQGVRKPADDMSAQYRHGAARRPHVFSYEPPPRGAAAGPPMYTPPSSFARVPPTAPPQKSSNVPKPIPTSAKPQNAYAPPPPPQPRHRPSTNNMPMNAPMNVPMNAPMKTPMNAPMNAPNRPNRPRPTDYKQQPPIPPLHSHPNPRNQIPPYDIPLLSFGLGPNGEWVYSLSLTLEELYVGKHYRFGITRAYLSRKSKHVVIEIDIPAGCRPGTRILCRNVGHEWKPGAFQDIAFIIEEVPHDRFIRIFDDLIMDVRLPWVDGLRRQGGKVPLMGIDGRNLVVQIDYPSDKNMKGRSIVKGAGMPVRERGQIVGRGNLIVQWEILPPKAKMMHFMRRLWGAR